MKSEEISYCLNEKEKLTVELLVDGVWQLGHFDLEAALRFLEHLLVIVGGDERNGESLGSETARSSDLA